MKAERYRSLGGMFIWLILLSSSLLSPLTVQGANKGPKETGAAAAQAANNVVDGIDELQRSTLIWNYQSVAQRGAARGETLYFYKCWMCHNKYADNGGPYLRDVFATDIKDSDAVAFIKGGSPNMPAFGSTLTDADLADLLAYLRSGKCCVEGEELPPNPLYHAESNPWPVQNSLSGGVHGAVRIASGDPPNGIKVQLIAPNGVRTTVTTDDNGKYQFPTLQSGLYTLRIATPLSFKPYRKDGTRVEGATQLDDIVLERVSTSESLPPTMAVKSQMSGAELLWNLPSTGLEKQTFSTNCSPCHSWQQILKNRYDEPSWRRIVTRMLTYSGGTLMKAQDGGDSLLEKDALDIIVQWLAKARGPGSVDPPQRVFLRPRGPDTRVVVTEYELPFAEMTPHDVAGDSKGNIWFTSHRSEYIGRMDPKTGVAQLWRVPRTPDKTSEARNPYVTPGTHRVAVDSNDNIWLSEVWNGGFTRFDPRTQQFQRFPFPYTTQLKVRMNTPGFANFGLAPDGAPWFSDSRGVVTRLDPQTGNPSRQYVFPKAFFSYDNMVSADGRYWAGGSQPFSGNQAELVDLQSGQQWTIFSGDRMMTPKRGGFDSADNAWYGGGNGTLIKLDVSTRQLHEYAPPIPPGPYAAFYEALPDGTGNVWAGVSTGRGFVRFNPKDESWREYVLPEPYAYDRRTWIDNSTHPVTVWYVDFNNYLVRIQPLE